MNDLTFEAEQGNSDAQYNLAEMYYHGHGGVPQDKAIALHWYTLSAHQGNTHAQFTLGYMHRHGEGVPQDYKAAFQWNRMAAENGDTDAIHRMGWACREGLGVTQDYILAYVWFDVATTLGHSFAGTDRDRLAKDMVRSHMGGHIFQAQRLARDWVAKHQLEKGMKNEHRKN